jgi:hypothetical protein
LFLDLQISSSRLACNTKFMYHRRHYHLLVRPYYPRVIQIQYRFRLFEVMQIGEQRSCSKSPRRPVSCCPRAASSGYVCGGMMPVR